MNLMFLFKVLFVTVIATGGFYYATTKKIPKSLGDVLSETKKFETEFNKNQKNRAVVDRVVRQVNGTTGQILGEAQKAVERTASDSATAIEGYVLKSALQNLIKQTEKLPTDQRDEIKKLICK